MKTKLLSIVLAAGSVIMAMGFMPSNNTSAVNQNTTGVNNSSEPRKIQLGYADQSSFTKKFTSIFAFRKRHDPLTNKSTVKITAYPNPANEEVNISFNLTSTEDITLSVQELTGKTIISKSVKEIVKGNNVFSLETINIKQGTYFVVASAKPNNIPIGTIKLVIRH